MVLTAAHCTAYLEENGITDVWVSFDPTLPATTLYHGVMHTNPGFNQRQSDPGDIAVIVTDDPVAGIQPAELPTAGLFDRLKKEGKLKGLTFTAVGYGALEPERGGGAPRFPDPKERRRAVSTFDALSASWLRLSQNPATGDGGTCYGDSGGPNFVGSGPGETDVIGGITITGDSMCRATNVDYRVDTPAA